MARYGRFLYYPDDDPRATLYGSAGIESYSIPDMSAEVIDYDKVNLRWTNPQGDILRLRLIRNQEGFPDTEEDGIILLDKPFRELNAASLQSEVDSGTTASGGFVPLIPGRHVYYSVWLWVISSEGPRWQLAATATETIPSPHATTSETGEVSTTHTRLLSSLPRVFTSDELNVLGEVNYSSDLAKFLEGITFTADQIMTFADLLAPSPGLVNLTPELLNSYALNFGIKPENKSDRRPTKFQRKLVSNALPMYMSKGKTDALEALVEALTGYQVYAAESSNMMLSAQDATFYGGVGNWLAETGCTISSVAGTAPSASEITSNEFLYRVDGTRIAQVVVSSATNLLTNGKDNPVLKGIPVRELSAYAFSLYQKKASVTTEEITLTVEWYDYTGRIIADAEETQTFDVTDEWSRVSLDYAQSPEKAAYASLSVEFSATGTYLLDMVQFADYSEEDFSEARGVGIAMSPSKRNYITNPSFEDSTTGWSADNATLAQEEFTAGTGGAPGDEIPGQYSGDYFLNVVSTEDDEVAVTTTTAEVITGSGDITFSAHTYSALAPSDGIEITVEAYAVVPYVNYVTVPTPTASPTTGWSYTGGTFTTSFPTTGGPEGNPEHVLLTYSAAQTTGFIEVAIANTGLTIDWDEVLADAEYTFAIWVKPDAAVTVVPTIEWTLAEIVGEEGAETPTIDPSIGDEVSLDANEWTRVEFTVQAPYGIESAVLSLDASRVGVTTFAIADAQFFPVTYTATGSIGTSSGKWERGSVTLPIPQDAVFPEGVNGLSVDVTLRYVSTGDAVKIDAVQLEDGYRQTDYFDGSFPYAYWDGAEDLSSSSLYANLDQKLTRVQQKIKTYLPLGTPYYVETSDGVEFGGSFKGYA